MGWRQCTLWPQGRHRFDQSLLAIVTPAAKYNNAHAAVRNPRDRPRKPRGAARRNRPAKRCLPQERCPVSHHHNGLYLLPQGGPTDIAQDQSTNDHTDVHPQAGPVEGKADPISNRGIDAKNQEEEDSDDNSNDAQHFIHAAGSSRFWSFSRPCVSIIGRDPRCHVFALV